MYRTCVVHAPIPCTVVDQDRDALHDRDLQDWEIEVLTYAANQEDANRSEDVGD
jgi:hypothetical protein